MILGTLLSLRRSNSKAALYASSCQVNRRSDSHGVSGVQYLSMGPVASALVLYVAKRMITRVLKRQLFRKGVVRKIKRLLTMLLELNVMHEVLCDMLEDLGSQ